MASSRPITEDDLDGFVDHLLDSARRSEVQAYLHDHPEIAACIAAVSRPREAPPPRRSRTNRYRRISICGT